MLSHERKPKPLAKTAEPFRDFLARAIAAEGPMDIARFMALALGHPEYGYYMARDPFGRGGDFITAPEVSQMFGEVLGAWTADLWLQMGSPDAFTLLECGPGRGTLMADMLRATQGAEGFHAACRVHLLETSPVLKARQAEVLQGTETQWHETLATVPRDAPVMVIGNEFLDALPVHQLEKTPDGWRARAVCLDEEGNLTAGHTEAAPALLAQLPEQAAETGAVFEVAPARSGFMQGVADLLRESDGAALFIDYGHERSGYGDTLQAVHKHRYVPVLAHSGAADLTAHVDFEALRRAGEGLICHGPVTQGAFLEALGIRARAAYLQAKAGDEGQKDIAAALHRLTHSDEMGTLFKVIGFSHGRNIKPAGF